MGLGLEPPCHIFLLISMYRFIENENTPHNTKYTVHHFTCDCLAGFSGQNCSTNIDDCQNNMCQVRKKNDVDFVDLLLPLLVLLMFTLLCCCCFVFVDVAVIIISVIFVFCFFVIDAFYCYLIFFLFCFNCSCW